MLSNDPLWRSWKYRWLVYPLFALIGYALVGQIRAADCVQLPDGTEVCPRANSQQQSPGNDKTKTADPVHTGSFGDWDAYLLHREKTCFVLSQPKTRRPRAKFKDIPGYVFISSRPAENVVNEVAINLGYQTKDGSAASAQVDENYYELITRDRNAWVKDQAKEKDFVDALRRGSRLIVKAPYDGGATLTDTYSLDGLSDALAQAASDCK